MAAISVFPMLNMSSDVIMNIYAHATETAKGETADKFAAYVNF